MRTRALLLLVLTLGGCAMPDSVPDWMSDDAAGPEPTNYRFIIANGLLANGVSTPSGPSGTVGPSGPVGLIAIVGSRSLAASVLEISNPRRVDTAKGATWMVCIKTLSYPARQLRTYHSVFIRRERIIDYRVSVGVDQCERETYTPFEWSVDKDNPTSR